VVILAETPENGKPLGKDGASSHAPISKRGKIAIGIPRRISSRSRSPLAQGPFLDVINQILREPLGRHPINDVVIESDR